MNRLPKTINPIRFAEKRLEAEGLMPLATMQRLKALCFVETALVGEAKVWIEGKIDEQGFKLIHGSAEADVSLICQRCMRPIDYHLSSEFNLSPVSNEEEADNLPPNYEPLYFTEQEVKLQDLVEDELILALPLVAKHSDKECSVSSKATNKKPIEKTYRPFEGLDKKL